MATSQDRLDRLRRERKLKACANDWARPIPPPKHELGDTVCLKNGQVSTIIRIENGMYVLKDIEGLFPYDVLDKI